MILFLDFDGVLHHSDVFLSKKPGHMAELPDNLIAKGYRLFQHAGILDAALEPYPDLKIVLSTSWAHKWGWERASTKLPDGLMCRVIGQTNYKYGDWMDGRCRGQQVQDHAKSMGLKFSEWVAIDDDVAGWPVESVDRLVHSRPDVGLSDPETVSRLMQLLAQSR